jgi:hypothetical protein
MYLQGKDNVYDLIWADGVTYGDVYHQNEVEQSTYNFEHSNVQMLFEHFNQYEREAKRLIEAGLPLPGYEMVMKCSHTFNLLDARGAISVTERAAYIGRVRTLARLVAQAYYESRERLGAPVLSTYGRECHSLRDDRFRYTRHAAYYNSTGVQCGRKMRRHYRAGRLAHPKGSGALFFICSHDPARNARVLVEGAGPRGRRTDKRGPRVGRGGGSQTNRGEPAPG